jgi:hypothetical protein
MNKSDDSWADLIIEEDELEERLDNRHGSFDKALLAFGSPNISWFGKVLVAGPPFST